MSATAHCIGSSLRSVSTHSSSSLACGRALIPGARAYGQTAFGQRPPPRNYGVSPPRKPRDSKPSTQSRVYYPTQWKQNEGRHSESSTQETYEDTQRPDSQVPVHFAEYLNRLFSPLQFPPELAQRVLTHNSHVLSRRGHNAALSFTGRRALSAYLHLFLQSCPTLSPSHDLEQITANTLHTNLLGEHVGHEWGVGRVLIWQPAAASDKLAGERTSRKVLQAAGLYKVSGEAVQAMIGAIYTQFGASVALKVFHTRLLPLLRVKGGLPREFYEHASKVSREMGGVETFEVLEGMLEKEKVEVDTRSKVEALSS